MASEPSSRPRGTTGATAATEERDREREQDNEHDELGPERHPEAAADVGHVAQLALVERRRPVRQLRPLEQHDPSLPGRIEWSPIRASREPLRRRQPVAVGREAVALDLVPDEPVGGEHAGTR